VPVGVPAGKVGPGPFFAPPAAFGVADSLAAPEASWTGPIWAITSRTSLETTTVLFGPEDPAELVGDRLLDVGDDLVPVGVAPEPRRGGVKVGRAAPRTHPPQAGRRFH
jgi:hypothetical protein